MLINKRIAPILAAGWLLFAAALACAQDRLAVAIPYGIERVDPLLTGEPVNRIILANLGAGLTRLQSPDFALELASNASVSADGLIWSFSLREGLRASDAGDLDASAVERAFNFLRTGAQNAGTARVELQGLINIKEIVLQTSPSYFYAAPAHEKIEFVLRHQDPNFGRSIAALPLVDTHIADAFAAEHGKGTMVAFFGPYLLKESRPGERILLEANPNYYRESFPRSRLLEFRVFKTAGEALSALRLGGVEIIAFSTRELEGAAADDPSLSILSSPLKEMAPAGGWSPLRQGWSGSAAEDDRLITTRFIVRKSLKLDQRALEAFDLSESYLP